MEGNGKWNFNDSSNNDAYLQHEPTEDSSIFLEGNWAYLKRHNKRCIYIKSNLLMQKPLVIPNSSWLKKGKK